MSAPLRERLSGHQVIQDHQGVIRSMSPERNDAFCAVYEAGKKAGTPKGKEALPTLGQILIKHPVLGRHVGELAFSDATKKAAVAIYLVGRSHAKSGR